MPEKKEVDPNQTKLSTFTLGSLPRAAQCKGCQKSLYKGDVALFKLVPMKKGKGDYCVMVCNEDCLADYDHAFWQAVASKNQGTFRPTVTGIKSEFIYGDSPRENFHRWRYEDL